MNDFSDIQEEGLKLCAVSDASCIEDCLPARPGIIQLLRFQIVLRALWVMPEPIFDTQLAAEFCSRPPQIGYAGLVKAVLGIELEKSETRTRWHKRPLTRKQILYSLDDVRYLKPLYDALNQELHGQSQAEWMLEEQNGELSRMRDFRIDPAHAYLRFRPPGRATAKGRQIIRTLANWREKKAQNIDLPRNWILTDKVINAIAEAAPDNMASLKPYIYNSSRFSNAFTDEVLSCIKNAGQQADNNSWTASKQLTEPEKQQVQLLRKLVENIASDHNLPVTRLATRQDIVEYVQTAQGRLASGWRSRLLARISHQASRDD